MTHVGRRQGNLLRKKYITVFFLMHAHLPFPYLSLPFLLMSRICTQGLWIIQARYHAIAGLGVNLNLLVTNDAHPDQNLFGLGLQTRSSTEGRDYVMIVGSIEDK
jgi:hypothetical protein